MPEINGNLQLVYNPWGDTAHCFVWHKAGAPFFSVSQTIEQGKFIQDGDTISIPLNYDVAIHYNYLIGSIQTYDVEGLYFPAYFFITGYNYKNAETTEIKIALDTMQTFFPSIARINGHLSRAHAPRYISVKDSEGGRHQMINPDLYFMEDEGIVSKYICTGYRIEPKIGSDLICITFTMSTSDWNCLQGDRTMYLTPLIDAELLKDYPITNVIGENMAGFTEDNMTSPMIPLAGHMVEIKQIHFSGLTNNTTGSIYVGGKLTFNNMPTQTGLKTTGRTQTYCLLLDPQEGEITPYETKYVDGYTKDFTNLKPNLDEVSIDTIIQFCTSLQDRIINIFTIPRPNGFNSAIAFDALRSKGIAQPITPELGVWWDMFNTEGQKALAHRLYKPFKSACLITDVRALSFIYGSSYGFTYGKNPSITSYANVSDEGEERSPDKEAKLKLYPYCYECFNLYGGELPVKYQEFAWLLYQRFSVNDISNEWLRPVVYFDPLATSPVAYIETALNPFITNLTEKTDEQIATYFNAIVGSQMGQGYDRTFNNNTTMPDTAVSIPTYAVYQDSYTAYASYSKALDVSSMEYQAKMAKAGATAQIVGGTFAIGGGITSTALGVGNAFMGDGPFAEPISKGIGAFGKGISSLINAGATLKYTPSYLYGKQALKEASLQAKPPSQTAGAYTGNITYLAQGDSSAIDKRYELPIDLQNILEQKFYYYGYYIPMDIQLVSSELENADSEDLTLETVINDRRYFCYLQFDSISVLSFRPAEGSELLPAMIPTIYRDDIARRLINGITFVHVGNGAPGDDDISRYNIPVDKDNESNLSYHNGPFFNRNWRNK